MRPMPATDVTMVAPGTPLGRYLLLERIGAGGMGEVFAAYDPALDRKVALKLLRRDDEKHRSFFQREAHAMARLSHPNVVPVFDAGSIEGRVFLTMELVPGRTLRRWERDTKPGPRALLRAYVAAGRGLAAAHAAGVVHRDFKPHNVLVSEDGQVKVTDFGVAHEMTRRVLPPEQSGDISIVGTPMFMSPEQMRGETVDARSDQFSFCVALYEALYGSLPFDGDDEERLDSIRRGTLPDGRITRVPAHLRRALARGLSYEREKRFPSMDALLEELLRDPARQRRLWGMIAGASVALVVGAWAVHGEVHAHRATLCTGGQMEADETWNDGIRRNVERALLDTGEPYAEDTWRRTRARIDAYMASWVGRHRATCEATRLRGEQTESAMDLRMACLERRREEVHALTNVLASADREVASKAVQAAEGLTSVNVCDDLAALTAAQPEPTAPDRRAELARVRAGLSGAKENIDAGRFALAREQLGPMAERARALGFQPAIAEALYLSSVARAQSGDWQHAADDARASVAAADIGQDDARRSMAEIALVQWLTETGSIEDARHWAALAEATMHRMGDEPEAKAEWLDSSGWLLHRTGEDAEAARQLREGLQLAERTPLTPQRVAQLARALADVDSTLGNYAEAREMLARADRALLDEVGDAHPSRIPVLVNRSAAAARANQRRDELEYASQAIALAERVAPDHHVLGVAYLDACDALLRMGQYAAALPRCRQATDLSRRAYGSSATYVAYADTTTGDVLLGLHRTKDAENCYSEAVAIHERSDTRRDSDYADALRGLGTAKLRAGRPLEARLLLERALAAAPDARQASGDDAAIVASIEFSLAQCFGPRSGDSRARVHARRALELYRQAERDEEADDVERWLDQTSL